MKTKITKLPKWAQDHIKNLERNNTLLERNLEKQIALNNDTHPESNTYYQLFGNFIKRFLPDCSWLVVVGKGTRVSMFVDHEGQIRIDIGDGLIMPQARNSIYIMPEKTHD